MFQIDQESRQGWCMCRCAHYAKSVHRKINHSIFLSCIQQTMHSIFFFALLAFIRFSELEQMHARKFLCPFYASAMVTSTSTPGSMLIEVCATVKEIMHPIHNTWIIRRATHTKLLVLDDKATHTHTKY